MSIVITLVHDGNPQSVCLLHASATIVNREVKLFIGSSGEIKGRWLICNAKGHK